MSTPADRKQRRLAELSQADLGQGLTLDKDGRICVKLSGKSALNFAADGLTVGFDEDSLELVPGSPLKLKPKIKKLVAAVVPLLPSGPQGPAGPAGADGAPGADGDDGASGADGNDGSQGDQGVPGNTGSQGIQGVPGNDGIDGDDGGQGIPGNDGAEGDQGIQGIQGIQGPEGPQGPPGSGASATTVEVNLGATPAFCGKFTITDAAIGPTSKVLCWQAPGPYTGKGLLADAAEMEPVQVIAAEPGTGSAIVKWQTPPMVVESEVYGDGLRDGSSVGLAVRPISVRRVGRVRGNVKFSYLVLS